MAFRRGPGRVPFPPAPAHLQLLVYLWCCAAVPHGHNTPYRTPYCIPYCMFAATTPTGSRLSYMPCRALATQPTAGGGS